MKKIKLILCLIVSIWWMGFVIFYPSNNEYIRVQLGIEKATESTEYYIGSLIGNIIIGIIPLAITLVYHFKTRSKKVEKNTSEL